MSRAQLSETVQRVAHLSFSRSGGPGGQNVNKVNTQAVLRVPIASLGLLEDEEQRVRRRLANRITASGELILHSSETRSQLRNRELAIERAVDLIERARHPAPKRKPTRPGRAAKERRLRQKKARAERKRHRQTPDRDA
jgi:ribosome-associated protein